MCTMESYVKGKFSSVNNLYSSFVNSKGLIINIIFVYGNGTIAERNQLYEDLIVIDHT